MKKVFILKPNEDWCVDRMGNEFFEGNRDMCVASPMQADVIWLMADWCFFGLAKAGLLDNKKVLTCSHHFVPTKFGKAEIAEFVLRDKYTTAYHVFNNHTLEQVKEIQENLKLPKKDVHVLPYWANNHLFKPTSEKLLLRQKYNVPQDAYVVGSFQRDTEGSSISSGEFVGKWEKGPDTFCDYVIAQATVHPNVHVLLAGWRRQYVINRLQCANISYTYIELPKIETINELYGCLDLYVVSARYEGGPQALLETALCNVPTISTPVGIAEDVLPAQAISTNLLQCVSTVPVVPDDWKIPRGFEKYRTLLNSI
jgi:hypothetical protein